MITREELLSSPEYWFEDAQNELYRQVIEYMEREGINQNQLAERLGVSKGYVSQILKGEFNYTLKKLIEISLAIGQVPKIEYASVANVIEEDAKTTYFQLSTSQPVYTKFPITQSNGAKEKVAEPESTYSSTYKAA
jgi:transcriptional regulator with XRE-family HTH domain